MVYTEPRIPLRTGGLCRGKEDSMLLVATKGATAHEPRQRGLIESRENPRFAMHNTSPETTTVVSSLQRDQQRKALICD